MRKRDIYGDWDDTWNAAVIDPFVRGDLRGVADSTPRGIVAGERAAGKAMVMDAKLPLNGIAPVREQLESLGFQFGEECGGRGNDGTSMYIECKLPEGWRKGHDDDDPYGRCSFVFNVAGEKVATIFVKETSYDRYASISFDKSKLVSGD